MNPLGGTELQHNFLHKNVKKELLEGVQICLSVPEKTPLSKDKVNILWQKNAPNQPNIAPWFQNKENHLKYDWYVFNSHWNYEQFRKSFNLPTDRCHVIKNGVTSFPDAKNYKKGDRLRILHHNTPWRGLNVLLGAMQYLEDENIELDVYSSCEVYGDEFKKDGKT